MYVRKKKYFLHSLIESVDSYVKIVTSYDKYFAKKGYLMGAIHKKTEILNCETAILDEDMALKNGKVEIKEL